LKSVEVSISFMGLIFKQEKSSYFGNYHESEHFTNYFDLYLFQTYSLKNTLKYLMKSEK
jgi:hypothetical protein